MSSGREAALPIGEVERRTGIAKDTLRVWERRYGFPAPQRISGTNRSYPADQVDKLVLIRALIDRGGRPAGLCGLSTEALRELLGPRPAPGAPPHQVEAFFEDLGRGHVDRLLRWLSDGLLRNGLGSFVLDIAAPSAVAVGEAWASGRLEIYAEHLFTEQLSRVLRAAIADLPPPAPEARPRVLLATLPGEPHVLGLLMAEAMFALEGAACLSLGAETPPTQILAAAAAHASDIVALSLSAAVSPRALRREVDQLLAGAGTGVEIWMGGAGAAASMWKAQGLHRITDLSALSQSLRAWRARSDAA